MRSAEGSVGLVEIGERTPLSPAADLTAYRVVQEALTNTRKHAGPGATAEVRLRWEPDALEVDVTDDGLGSRAAAPSMPGGGRGIQGMRERAEAVGGSLAAGPRPDGGFRVRLRLPAARSR